jgi:hypothetical protein
MHDSITIRPYQPGDEAAICAAVGRTRPGTYQLEDWAWCHPPLPSPRRIAVARQGETVIAHAAANPVPASIEGEPGNLYRCVHSLCSDPSDDCDETWTGTVACFAESFLSTPEPTLLLELEAGDGAHGLAAAIDAGESRVLAPTVLCRRPSGARRWSLRRCAYRLELARDWEPALDLLWSRAGHCYPTSAHRDAAHSLARLSGHPRVRHHRFLVFPRLSATPVAFAAFTTAGSCCRWVDLVWDRDHPGAIELLARVSSRLAAQSAAGREEIWIAGDGAAVELLTRAGFSAPAGDPPTFTVRALNVRLPSPGQLFMTMADATPCSTGALGWRMTGA